MIYHRLLHSYAFQHSSFTSFRFPSGKLIKARIIKSIKLKTTKMDVENREDIDHSMDIENPMLVEIMPVAKVVGIEVNSEVLIEPKRQREPESRNIIPQTFCEKVHFWIEISVIVIIGFAFLAGFILFLVWLIHPNIFGPAPF